jgi:hypothetical protein
MNRYLDFFLIAFVVFGAAALIYNIHKYGLDPTIAALRKALGLAETHVVSDAEVAYTAAKADLSLALNRVESIFAKAQTTQTNQTNAPAAAPKPTGLPVAAPVGAPPIVLVPTCNGVPVPAGMTLTAFTQLVTAKQAVMGFLAPSTDASIVQAIVMASDLWFSSLGPYFVQQLVEQAPVGSAVATRVATYVSQYPVALAVTPAQDAAALAAVNAVVPRGVAGS